MIDKLMLVGEAANHEDKTLTIEEVGNLVDEFSNMNDIAEKVGEAFTLAFGSKGESPKGE